jgi:hypothetical protein
MHNGPEARPKYLSDASKIPKELRENSKRRRFAVISCSHKTYSSSVTTDLTCAWGIVTGEPILPISALRKWAESHFRDAVPMVLEGIAISPLSRKRFSVK